MSGRAAAVESDPWPAADGRSAAIPAEHESIERLARLPVSAAGARGEWLVDRLNSAKRTIDVTYRELAEAPLELVEVSRGTEWLLDNYHVVKRALRMLAEEFPSDFERRLPKLTAGSLRGYPLAYSLAAEMIDIGSCRADLEAVTRLLHGFQTVRPLSIAEIWALPALLRLVVLENLAEAAVAVVRSGKAGADDDAAPSSGAVLDPDQVVATCVQSLRTLETTDWKGFFESVSETERILRQDPAGVYARMDFDTRDAYRKAVEELATRTESSEQAVAGEAIRVSQESPAGSRAAHVGYHLIDSGLASLERRLGYRWRWKAPAHRRLLTHPTMAYLGAILLLTACFEVALGGALIELLTGPEIVTLALLLALVPVATIAVSLTNAVVTRLLPPSVLPKMDLERGIPADCRTLVAIPALLTDPAEIASLLSALEIRFLANRDPHLHFALLTDLADAAEEHLPEDAGLLERAAEGIRALNTRYAESGAAPFHLFHRPRKWSAAENRWIGWERKRGKLAELNRVLRANEPSGFSTQVGDPSLLKAIRFVIALDADTELPRGAARRLIATLAHPLNRAELDARTGRVIAGYTVLQPRIEISPLAGEASRLAKLFSGEGGLDPYARAMSDVYQDLFGEGIYVGKGIYDVSAFEKSLEGRIPEATLLSHDLFEGIHGRAGLVTDVVLLEDTPIHYLAYARRLHRWARGDWQLLPWLGSRVPLEGGATGANRLSVISRWKIVDNLRRSLVAPSLLGLLVLGWLCLPGSPTGWTLAVALVLAGPGLTDLTGRLVATRWPDLVAMDLRHGARALWAMAEFWLFEIAFLPHQAFVIADAIARTLMRMYVTRRRLLQWTSAAHTARKLAGDDSRWRVWREMAAAPALALLIVILLWVMRPGSLPVAGPFVVLWLVSPEVAVHLSRRRIGRPHALTDSEVLRLRILARRTWSFFETFVTPEDQWLPPDHFQEEPRGVLARRTSPTNIGLSQVATISAYDFGHLGLLWATLRLNNTLDTLERMERYRGHFLNWYDTESLEPLAPRYVSAADSGNLIGSLLTVKQACIELRGAPPVREREWDGFLDTLAVLREGVGKAAKTSRDPAIAALEHHVERIQERVRACQEHPLLWADAVSELIGESCSELDRLLVGLIDSGSATTAVLSELRMWSSHLRQHLDRMQREMEMLVPWLAALARPPELFQLAAAGPLAAGWEDLRSCLALAPALSELPSICSAAMVKLARLETLVDVQEALPEQVHAARAWSSTLTTRLGVALETADYLLQRLEDVADRSDSISRQTDFSLLYDEKRRLLHIGYNVTASQLDEHHYDLLASEARLASFIAIAKGDVPEEHWIHLGRPIGSMSGTRSLLSWSGTMFEYLMPPLFLREGEETLIGQSCKTAVREQIAYGRRRKVPWGISESGYYRFDAYQNYQYQAFGVPSLGFKRGLEDDLVIAPYASVLALRFEPGAVLENLQRLQEVGMCGRHGLYEAIDFTPSRMAPDQEHALVRSFMAHHQGMVLAALNDFLHGNLLVQRFHAEPIAQTAALLLYERPAGEAPIEQTRPAAAAQPRRVRRPRLEPWRPAADAPCPQAHVLSGGRLSVVATDRGSGFSRYAEVALSRSSGDPVLDDAGLRFHLKDLDGGLFWPLFRGAASATDREVVFHAHMVEMHARYDGVSVRQRITVAPTAPVEIRYLTLANQGIRRRNMAVWSYDEVVLDSPAAYQRHPAFSKLFVESEYLADRHALIFRRRLASPNEAALYLLHMAVLPGSGARRAGHETSRELFLGRGGTASSPAALRESRADHSGTTAAATLDPIMALAAELDLDAYQTRELAFVTLVADSRQAAIELADQYRSLGDLDWIVDAARENSETEMAALGLRTSGLAAVERLLSLLLYPHHGLRASADVLARNRAGRSGLWRYGLSGDLPILLVRVSDATHATLLHELLRGQAYWRGRGIHIDLVVLNESATAYGAEIDERLARAIASTAAESATQRPGGVFLIRADQIADAERTLLLAAARVVLDGSGGSLADQLGAPAREPSTLPPLTATRETVPSAAKLELPGGLLFDNGLGGFTPEGREYVIHLGPGEWTPAPWVNVMANPRFGSVVSESGGGFTWAENSGENRLTPWRNDPVSDEPGETVYLRDEETGEVWSPTPLPARGDGEYQVRHGAGYTIFRHASHELEQQLRLFVPVADPVKVIGLRLVNRSDRPRRLTATFYVEWVLGSERESSHPFIIPEFDFESEALMATNPWNEVFAESVAFAAASQKLHGLTGDRAEFFGPGGQRAQPAALTRVGLANAVRAGLDPCAALQMHVDLAVGESKEIHFLLGQGRDRNEALQLAKKYREGAAVEAAWTEVLAHWDGILGAVEARTPDPALDMMLNRWLLYQTLTSRVWGRTGFYQSSGAFGFRDQLQDVAALVQTRPALCRAQLLECARHQFEEGDVLHWWHPPSGAGVRTRFSDDLLWLPFITAHYVAATGDAAVLSERIPFLAADPLRPEEVDRYGRFPEAKRAGTLYDHCLRAIDRADTKGAHGLPLFGSGDWNDGMNHVGIGGKGESVWLAWFLCATLEGFAPLCRAMGEAERAEELLHDADAVREAIEANAWDGGWYRRGYYDDGSPLGSAKRDECRIDSIAQSWAVLSGAGDQGRARLAMQAVRRDLVRERESLILLFTPPFDRSAQDPGYVRAYPPGVRENGGQYTHAAVWTVWALARIGEGDLAARLFTQLLPVRRSLTPETASLYRVEPYVMAADVYGEPACAGRGGWTWYTGSAGWAYRFGWEVLLGLRLENDTWRLDPHVPRSWPAFEITLRDGDTIYRLRVDNPHGSAGRVKSIRLDGNMLEGPTWPRLHDGRAHSIEATLGSAAESPEST